MKLLNKDYDLKTGNIAAVFKKSNGSTAVLTLTRVANVVRLKVKGFPKGDMKRDFPLNQRDKATDAFHSLLNFYK